MRTSKRMQRKRDAAKDGDDPRLGEEDLAFLATCRMGDLERPSVTADIVAVALRGEATGDWRTPARRRAPSAGSLPARNTVFPAFPDAGSRHQGPQAD